jgi:cell division protein FtsX
LNTVVYLKKYDDSNFGIIAKELQQKESFIMSQAKVDKYKQEKAHRKQNIAKAKRNRVIGYLVLIAIIAVLVVWAGISIHSLATKNATPSQTYLNTEAIETYINNLNAD